jgi:hypothetical protein
MKGWSVTKDGNEKAYQKLWIADFDQQYLKKQCLAVYLLASIFVLFQLEFCDIPLIEYERSISIILLDG